MNRDFTIIKLGGSLLVPNLSDRGGIHIKFVKAFHALISQEIHKGKQFIIVVGGGATSKLYQRTAPQITSISNEDIDWIGIYATRLNAVLLAKTFLLLAYPRVIEAEPSKGGVRKLQKSKNNLFIAAGWRPGRSTDFDTVKLAEKFKAKEIIKAGDIPFVYEQDPKEYPQAKPITKISWRDYRKLIPSDWTPKLSVPFDPIATKLAQKLRLRVKIIQGNNLSNFQKAIEGKQFEGTVISSR